MTAPTLATGRLVLRAYRSGDVDDVLAYAADREWGRYLPVPDPYTRADAEEFVAASALADGEWKYRWAITHGGRVRGGINLRVLEPGAGEIGYNVARPLWGRGLATEAAAAVVGFGFDGLGLERIEAVADIRNAASWRVMEKLGMRLQARRIRLDAGERVDDVVYAVRRDEWRAGERPRAP